LLDAEKIVKVASFLHLLLRLKLHADSNYGRFPVIPMSCLSEKIHSENPCCLICRYL